MPPDQGTPADEVRARRLVGYACPDYPDGPLIPPHALYDPCGKDVAVYDDGTTDPPNFGGSPLQIDGSPGPSS